MSGWLLDTNVVSELRKAERGDANVRAWLHPIESDSIYLSVLTLGEIRAGIERIRARDPVKSQVLERWLVELEGSFAERVLPVTSAIADRWGRLPANASPSVVDGLIAATAGQHDLVLVTRDERAAIRTRVNFVNPFKAAR